MVQAAGDSSDPAASLTKLRRRFVQLSQQQSADPGSNLRVLQFNTLADGLAQNGDFIAVRTPDRSIVDETSVFARHNHVRLGVPA